MTDDGPLLVVRGLVSGYGELEILHGLDLDLHAGEIVAIIGTNGAGKTTLMKSITGLLRVRQGDVTVAGTSLRRLAAEKIVGHGVSLVPEGRHVFADLTVEDNLLLGGYQLDRATVAERMEKELDRFPRLRERRKQDAGSLSGGEQQMLVLSRALMRAPRVLLLDEPSMGLAPIVVEQVFEAIASLRDDGVSVLLVEQNVAAALDVADRAYVIESGQIVREASAAVLREDSDLASAFLGGTAETSEPAVAPSERVELGA
ncbi:MAG: livF [Nocardioidaceae bacterium]|nr:livF [Nocardioidaceae bacterium]